MPEARGAVVVFGSANVDLTVRTPRAPGPGETVLGDGFAQSGGGKGANQAVAAARMGAVTRFVGRVGDDPLGHELAADLAAAGVDVTHLVATADAPTGVAVIVVDAAADNRIVVAPGANATLDATDLDRLDVALDGAAVLLLQLEVPMPAAEEAARRARERGVTVVLDPAPVPPGGVPDALLRLASILTPNEHEAAQLGDALHAGSAQTVIVTEGERGARWRGPDGAGEQQPPPVTARDTTGAGDAFDGALAAALAEGHDVTTAIAWGLAAGALSVTRLGAQPAMPERAEVLSLLRR